MLQKNVLKVLSLLILVLFIACEKDSQSPDGESTDPDAIDAAIENVNEDVQSSGLEVSLLTREHFDSWFEEFAQFVPLKQDRQDMLDAVADGELPPDCYLALQDFTAYDLPSGIVFQPHNLPIVEGNNSPSYLEWLEDMLISSSGDLALTQEPFQGPLPSDIIPVLNEDIQFRITEIDVEGSCLVPGWEERDALKIEVLLNSENKDDVANWFGTGFDKVIMQNTMSVLIGSHTEIWVDIEDLFPNWLKNKINTFPVDGDNEVCHGAAREFYYIEQESSLNASTEATTLMLANYYCTQEISSTPVFGDYLYIPGQHSGRYILRDPNSGRDIVFSVQSGGVSAYRFWWLDEDFSGNPFANIAVDNLLSTTIDVWRRCRD